MRTIPTRLSIIIRKDFNLLFRLYFAPKYMVFTHIYHVYNLHGSKMVSESAFAAVTDLQVIL